MEERKWKQADNDALRKIMVEMVPGAIREVLGHPIHHRIMSTSIMETKLDPVGRIITMTVAIQVTPKEEEK